MLFHIDHCKRSYTVGIMISSRLQSVGGVPGVIGAAHSPPDAFSPKLLPTMPVNLHV